MVQPGLFSSISHTVSELTRYLMKLVEADILLQDIWITGEISNLSKPVSGHIYFTLKDNAASLRCVIWKSNATRIANHLQNGLAVEAHGHISIYERDGQYQLYVDAVRPAGEGLLFQEFMRLKAALEAEGLFAEERKRPIPERPRLLGVVTSSTAAACQDIINTLRDRNPLVEVVISPTAVQGENAPPEIVKAIEIQNFKVKPDVILIARGGGSLEDLWAFNDERVVRAIANSNIPTITGIGHETDFTLSDFASDLRAPTPTGAAVQATPHINVIKNELDLLRNRLSGSILSSLDGHQVILEDLSKTLGNLSPLNRIQNYRQRLDGLSLHLLYDTTHYINMTQAKWKGINDRLSTLNPLAVLSRGYAIVSKIDGRVITDVDQIQIDEKINIRLAGGEFFSRVDEIT